MTDWFYQIYNGNMADFLANKKFLLAGALVIVILAAISLFFFWPKKESPLSPQVWETTTFKKPEAPAKLLSYKDPLGFSFSYPDSFSLNTHPEDSQNYADVELTAKNGTVKFLVSDTIYEDINAWQKEEFKNANFLDTKLGNLEAKKVYTDTKIILATLWDGMLFQVEATPADNKELVKTMDTILTYLQIPETANYTDGTTSTPPDSTSTTEVTEEEIIE